MRLVAVIVAVTACAPPAVPRPADPCRRTPAEWRAWQAEAVARLLTPTLERDGRRYIDTAVVGAESAAILGDLTSCPTAPAMDNLRRFTRAQAASNAPDRQLGMNDTDRAYIAGRRRLIELPPLLRSQPFLRALASPATYADAAAMIQQRNRAAGTGDRWDLLIYESRFLTTPDKTTYGRFFVRVPGDVEQWIQFGIELPGRPVHREIHSASVVSLHRGEAVIADYWRTRRGEAVHLTTRVEAGKGGSNCYNCHKAAVLPIRPATTFTFDDGGALVASDEPAPVVRGLNQRIRGYGPPRFGGAMEPGDFGPPLGPPGRERTDVLLAACAPDLDGDARRRVAGKMRCASCHDGVTLGAINFPQAVASDQDVRELRHPHTGASVPMVATFIGEGWMPPGNALTPGERAALARCLTREYREQLAEWLLR